MGLVLFDQCSSVLVESMILNQSDKFVRHKKVLVSLQHNLHYTNVRTLLYHL